MNPITNYLTTSYGTQRVSYASNAVKKQTRMQEERQKKLQEQLRALSKTGQENSGSLPQNRNAGTIGRSNANSIVNSSWLYGESLKAQRQDTRNANLQKKKVRYKYKDISSKIISSKTSHSARQVANQAKRELLRLKRERAKNGSTDDELEAAIAHAKAMERVAKKKLHHLEQEEMTKASAGPLQNVDIEENKDTGEDTDAADEEWKAPEDDSEDFLAEYADMSEELMTEVFEDLEEGMRDLLEEMGFGELADSMSAVKGDMDPEDLKMMKIKHRNQEMKEIVKADAEYLKAVFKSMEKVSIDVSVGGAGSTPAPSEMAGSTASVDISV